VVAIRTSFDRQLRLLETEVLRLAEMAETQLVQAVKALNDRDYEAAHRIESYDSALNKLRYDIEEQSYTLLALQQPNASDMRRIVAAVSIATNLERMGDHAAGIARLAIRLEEKSHCVDVPEFEEMTRLAAENLQQAMIALNRSDPALARHVIARDAAIDRLHKTVYDELINVMTRDTATVECATIMLWVSHNIERFADRTSNICARTIYAITGNLFEQRVDPMP